MKRPPSRTKSHEWFTKNMRDPEFRRIYERASAHESVMEQVFDLLEQQRVGLPEFTRRMNVRYHTARRMLNTSDYNLALATIVDMALVLNRRVKITLEPVSFDIPIPTPSGSSGTG